MKSKINKSFLRVLLPIALPIALQSVIINLLNMIDEIMICQLGETMITSVSVANKMTSILNFTLSSLVTAMSIFVSRYNCSENKHREVNSILDITILFGGIIIALGMMISIGFPDMFISFFTTDSEVIVLASKFLRIIAISYIPLLFTCVFSAFMKARLDVKLPVVASIIGVVINVVANYILIFGKFNFPKLGIIGAGVATVLARVVEVLIIIIYVIRTRMLSEIKFSNIRSCNFSLIKPYLNIALPILISELLWVLGDVTYSAIYGRIGTYEYTAIAVLNPIQGVLIGFMSGLSASATVIIGNLIGENHLEKLKSFTKKYILTGVLLSIVLSLLLILFINNYVGLFNIQKITCEYAKNILMLFSIFLVVKVTNMIIGSGILTSGGDSKFILIMDGASTWLIGVPLGLITAYFFKMPIYYVYIFINLEEVIRVIVGVLRIRSMKWIKKLS